MAFKKEARDNLCQYVLLEKPIWSHNDMAYIEQLVTELMKVHFLKEAGKCLVYYSTLQKYAEKPFSKLLS